LKWYIYWSIYWSLDLTTYIGCKWYTCSFIKTYYYSGFKSVHILISSQVDIEKEACAGSSTVRLEKIVRRGLKGVPGLVVPTKVCYWSVVYLGLPPALLLLPSFRSTYRRNVSFYVQALPQETVLWKVLALSILLLGPS
jgi:hypothetical protein